MTKELSNEQIVTNLLVSNEILRPFNVQTAPNSPFNLGEYMSNVAEEQMESKKHSRYSFIDLDGGWNF